MLVSRLEKPLTTAHPALSDISNLAPSGALLPRDDGDTEFADLTEHATQRERVYRHKRRVGDRAVERTPDARKRMSSPASCDPRVGGGP